MSSTALASALAACDAALTAARSRWSVPLLDLVILLAVATFFGFFSLRTFFQDAHFSNSESVRSRSRLLEFEHKYHRAQDELEEERSRSSQKEKRLLGQIVTLQEELRLGPHTTPHRGSTSKHHRPAAPERGAPPMVQRKPQQRQHHGMPSSLDEPLSAVSEGDARSEDSASSGER
jgi:hypothetical protein